MEFRNVLPKRILKIGGGLLECRKGSRYAGWLVKIDGCNLTTFLCSAIEQELVEEAFRGDLEKCELSRCRQKLSDGCRCLDENTNSDLKREEACRTTHVREEKCQAEQGLAKLP